MAKTIRKTVRIYRQHDLDLYSLGLSKKYHLGSQMKKALVAYATGGEYTPPELPKDLDDTKVKTSMLLILYFDKSKEDDMKALELLRTIKFGYGCSFIKTLFRSYLNPIPLFSYFSNNGLQMTNKEVVLNVQRIRTKALKDQEEKDQDKIKDSTNEKTIVEKITKEDYKENETQKKQTVNEERDGNNVNPNNFNSLFMQMNSFTHTH